MQQHLSQNAPGGPHSHPPIASVTTELVQKYLDENKDLILSILENQNLGNLNECAVFQQKLQSNLMFLAAVADAQTQPLPIAQQAHHRPMAMQYMSPQQAQKHMPSQAMMRNPMQYTPNEVAALQQAKLQQPQQGMHGQGGANVFQMNPSEAAMPMNNLMMSRGYPGGGVPEGVQISRGSAVEMRLSNNGKLIQKTYRKIEEDAV
ncbi:hypothetical protein GOP47_0022798 [Adiantum capillus-veneris]|uniref:SS18 N-terminal domain-containing protein n=1 Tax=Adiantum capillus-veneris TaxID=13818 RepID=A0A9D4Z5N9_ADICA|nr:hypothetical protein GOP47_0022798 [Adiantum capillus-veneris]